MAKNPRLIDISGLTFGELLVLRQDGNNSGGAALWRCRCSCGNETTVVGSDLRKGKSASCGHGKAERAKMLRLSHGQSGTRLYEIWQNMHRRCKDPDQPHYGARGISVCEQWADFQNFQQWAAESGYQSSLTIDRIDNDLGYSAENCRWADKKTQSANRRFVQKRSDGRLWMHVALENGITGNAYRQRVSDGWSFEEASSWPANTKRPEKIGARDSLGRYIQG